MNKLDALEDLLPGFQRFLSDLTTIRLTSDLEAQVNQYNQNIQDYVEQHCTIPSSPPPDPPKAATNGVKKESGDDFIAKQRELARSAHTTSADDSYYNVRVGQETTETDNSASIDNFYEPPSKSLQTPPVPTTKRPPLRIIDDMEAYEDPDEFVPEKPAPVKKYGKSSTMPHLSMQASSEQEATDSGGTFISFNSSSSSQPQEELSDYEMMPDHGNYQDDEDSWGSTDYEDYDEDEIQKNQTIDSVDANANAKKKKDKFEVFKRQFEKDPKVDHLGVLYCQGKGKTISKKSFCQWDKRYCLAKDMHLYGYKNYDSKKPALDMVLFGFEVLFIGQEGKRKNVFSLSHPNRGTELLSAESQEDADKWIEVLKNYATMGSDLVPSTGYVEKEGTSTRTTSEDITAKVVGTVANFFKREKKGKDLSPQLTVDDKGYLSGYINVMGAKYGEAKWRKKFITIEKGYLTCYTEDGDVSQFKFPLEGREMMLAGQKEAKRKGSMKIMKDGEILIFIEALNPLDMGHLLKKFMEEMTLGQKKETSTAQRGMVSDILKAFEKQGGEGADQPMDEFYDDIQISSEPVSPKPESGSIYQNFKIQPKPEEDLIYEYAEYQNSKPVQHLQVPTERKISAPSIYQNFKVAVQNAGKKKTAPSSPKPTKKDSEEAESKKDKKAKKKDKGKKDKKSKEKEAEVVAKEEEEEAANLEAAKKTVKRQSIVIQNKFEKSDKKHLLDVDRLEIERKEVEAKKREVTKMKIDLRSQKMDTTDPRQKELIEAELKKAQQSWSECSNRLAFINMEIERFTKQGEANMRIEEKQDTASAEMAKNGISDSAKKDSVTKSPGMEVMSKSAGNVQNKLKMFQQMNSK